MKQIKINDVTKYVENNIGTFHQARLNGLKKLKLSEVLRKKNPYLFKAKNILTAQDLIKAIIDSFLSSKEETIFGTFLEGLAIYVSNEFCGGKKSAAAGIDLEFEKGKIKYIVAIKSGPNWGNSGQINKMKEDFRRAKRILKTNSQIFNIVSVNGCCYGKDSNPDKGEYLKLCGQRFWEFISDNKNLYKEIIEPLGHKAKEKNENFQIAYSQVINKFTLQFAQDFCKNGIIDWNKLVEFNSSDNI
ncbi:MAG TPA: PmeII family type II restriction endonuclease [Ignavibacteriaceae bacterium]|nr:PmeII family type II restriction endonuclease [Ignavibacteriaceae bacterium]